MEAYITTLALSIFPTLSHNVLESNLKIQGSSRDVGNQIIFDKGEHSNVSKLEDISYHCICTRFLGGFAALILFPCAPLQTYNCSNDSKRRKSHSHSFYSGITYIDKRIFA